MKSLTPALIAVAFVSTTAWAQLPPIITSSQPYQPLTAGTVVPGLVADDTGVLVPLGFTFPYFGQNFTHVMLTTNGVIVPGVASTTTCSTGCLSNALQARHHLHRLLRRWRRARVRHRLDARCVAASERGASRARY